MMRNPVMFVVEAGSVLTTLQLVRDAVVGAGHLGFELQITFWLWVTVLFANFAEAMAEGRGKAQADTLRRAKTDTAGQAAASGRDDRRGARRRAARRRRRAGRRPASSSLATARSIEGVASVDESAITGESAPVIRESGGDRSAVTGGTKVLSDWHQGPGDVEPGRDVPGSDDRARRRRRAPEDAERDRAEHPARRPDDRLPARGRHAAAAGDLLRCAAVGLRAGRAARVPHPDDDRRPALGDRDRRHGSPRAAQRAGHVRTGRRGGGRRAHAAARQDGHDHPRQPAGDRVPAPARRHGAASWPTRPSWRPCPTRRPRAGRSWCWPRPATACAAATSGRT